MVGYEIITLSKVYSTVKENKNSIIKRDLKPAEKKLENVFKKLKATEDKQICHGLNQLIKECWTEFPDIRPTAQKGFMTIIYFLIIFLLVFHFTKTHRAIITLIFSLNAKKHHLKISFLMFLGSYDCVMLVGLLTGAIEARTSLMCLFIIN